MCWADIIMSSCRAMKQFSALQCRLECESGFVAQRTPLITCVNGEYAKGCHYWKIRTSEMIIEVEFLGEFFGQIHSKTLKRYNLMDKLRKMLYQDIFRVFFL